MKFQFRNEEHTIVFIEYYKGLPSNVITTVHVPNAKKGPYDVKYYWDFDKNVHWGDDLMYHLSGFGGDITEGVKLDGKAVRPKLHSYWAAEGVNVIESNYGRIESPLTIRYFSKDHTNPFDAAEEVSSTCWCNKCGGMVDEGICTRHMYDDDNGNLRWKGNHHYVNQ